MSGSETNWFGRGKEHSAKLVAKGRGEPIDVDPESKRSLNEWSSEKFPKPKTFRENIHEFWKGTKAIGLIVALLLSLLATIYFLNGAIYDLFG